MVPTTTHQAANQPNRSLCAEASNMRHLRELTLEGNEELQELPDLLFFPSLQILRVPTNKLYPIPRYSPLTNFGASTSVDIEL